MSISARNQLTGTITAITAGAVNDEVVLTLAGGAQIVSVVTQSSRETMGLAIGKEAIALIKAPWVILASLDCGLVFSARNQFQGQITSLVTGAVNTTVQVRTNNGLDITAVVTNESAQEMKLAVNVGVIALVKASSVVLATKAAVK